MSAPLKHDNTALVGIILLAIAALSVLLATGCASVHAPALVAERSVKAGAAAWVEHVEDEIGKCRAQALPTEAERAACIEPTAAQHVRVELGVASFVTALRAYWLGVSVGESPAELRRHLAEALAAVADLPVEQFGGLR